MQQRFLIYASLLTFLSSPLLVSAATVDVSITSGGFSPSSVGITAGDVVRWTNNDSVTHNVSSDPHPTHTNYTALNLGNIAPSATLTLLFPTAGTYGYHDHLDTSLTGNVVVAAAPSPPPPSPSGSVAPILPIFGQAIVQSVGTNSATIAWETERGSYTQLKYGTTSGSYPFQTTIDPMLTYVHLVTLLDLSASTTYYARAVGGQSLDQHHTSEEFTFATRAQFTILPPITTTTTTTTSVIAAIPAMPKEDTPATTTARTPPLSENVTKKSREHLATQVPIRVLVAHFEMSDLLRPGVRNEAVHRLQKFLSQFPDIYPDGLVTGYYGPLTRRAIERFQVKYNIVSTGDPVSTGYGQVGPRTRAKLNELIDAHS